MLPCEKERWWNLISFTSSRSKVLDFIPCIQGVGCRFCVFLHVIMSWPPSVSCSCVRTKIFYSQGMDSSQRWLSFAIHYIWPDHFQVYNKETLPKSKQMLGPLSIFTKFAELTIFVEPGAPKSKLLMSEKLLESIALKPLFYVAAQPSLKDIKSPRELWRHTKVLFRVHYRVQKDRMSAHLGPYCYWTTIGCIWLTQQSSLKCA